MSSPKFNNRNEQKHYEAGQRIVAKKLGKRPALRTRNLDADVENAVEERVGHRLGLVSGAGTEASMREDNERLKEVFATQPFFTKGFLAGQRKSFSAHKSRTL
jgi:hypothetical protein